MYPTTQFQSRIHAPPQSGGQAFHNPRTSLGAAGHWVHLAATLAPMAISELVEDAAKRRKSIMLVSVGSALAYQALWTMREQERRAEKENNRQQKR